MSHDSGTPPPAPTARTPDATAVVDSPPGDTTEASTAPGQFDTQPTGNDLGLWNRLGDRKATAVTATAAGFILVSFLIVMSLITDDITLTTEGTKTAERNGSITKSTDEATRPEAPAEPTTPPPTTDPSPPPQGPASADQDNITSQHRDKDKDEDDHHDEDDEHEEEDD